MTSLRRLGMGFDFIREGMGLIWRQPRLWIWAFIPFVIDVILLTLTLSWGWSQVSLWTATAVGYLISSSSGWIYSLLYYPLFLGLLVGFSVLAIYLTVLLANVIASPFNSILAEKILIQMGVKQDRPFHLQQWLATSARMLAVSLMRAVIFVFLGLFLFIMSFIPVLNILSSFIAFLILAFDSADYAFESLEMSLRERYAFFKRHRLQFCGMAGALALTLLIPGLTLVLLPSAVAGAASVVARSKRHDSGINTSTDR